MLDCTFSGEFRVLKLKCKVTKRELHSTFANARPGTTAAYSVLLAR